MAKKVTIDPISRIEGHLKLDVEIEGGKVVKAWSAGEMFRGWEQILVGRNPVDAQHIAMRICGVCPCIHAHASTLCLDMAFGIHPPKNGMLIRNLMLGANYIQSHLLHFYHLAALDFVDITAIAKYKGSDVELNKIKAWVLNALDQAAAGEPVAAGPFLPRYEGDYYIKDTDINIALIQHYVQALTMRRKAQEMLAIFGGRMPHEIGIIPGGATQAPTVDKIVAYKLRLAELTDFIENVYVPDVLALAKLAPAQAKITEQVKFSRFHSGTNLYPWEGETAPEPEKPGAYSWLKAPRYAGLPMEVGPAARLIVAYLKGHADVKAALDGAFGALGIGLKDMNSNLGRHLARAVECKMMAHRFMKYVEEIEPGKPFHTPFQVPPEGKGYGLSDGARGALGHWIVVKGGKIANYQAVVPTTWNCSPRDDKGLPGACEKALEGVPVSDPNNPIEPARVVRSYDPCLACAIHVVEGGKEVASRRVI